MSNQRGISIGEEDPFGEIPRPNAEHKAPTEVAGYAKSVGIGSGQFDKDSGFAGKSKDMATDYDPPTRYEVQSDLPGMSKETLAILEREMGMSLGSLLGGPAEVKPDLNPLMSVPLTGFSQSLQDQMHTLKKDTQKQTKQETTEETKTKPKKEKKVHYKDKKKNLTKEEEKEEKAKRLREWEEGGLKPGQEEKKSPHDLIIDKHNQDFVNYY